MESVDFEFEELLIREAIGLPLHGFDLVAGVLAFNFHYFHRRDTLTSAS